MKKIIDNCVIIIFAIALVSCIYCFCMYLGCLFQGIHYVKVDDENRDTIMELLEIDEISTKGEIKEIGKKTMLGDWNLYIEYESGSKTCSLLDDTVGLNIRDYIIENGIVGGTRGEMLCYAWMICLGITIVCAIYIRH